jgi:hypothetical protein
MAEAESVLNLADSTRMDELPYRSQFDLIEAHRQELRR